MAIDNRGFRDNPFDEEKHKFDAYAHAVTVIQEEHRLIHDGMYFSVNHAFTALANGANLDIVFKVPAGTFPHLRAWTYSLEDGPCNLSLFENPTLGAAGSVLTPTNNNRNSSRTAEMDVEVGTTISATGTAILEDQYVPDPGGGFFSSPGTSVADVSEEWILKQNEDYLLRLTNNSGGAIDGSVYIVFYEIDYAH